MASMYMQFNDLKKTRVENGKNEAITNGDETKRSDRVRVATYPSPKAGILAPVLRVTVHSCDEREIYTQISQ